MSADCRPFIQALMCETEILQHHFYIILCISDVLSWVYKMHKKILFDVFIIYPQNN